MYEYGTPAGSLAHAQFDQSKTGAGRKGEKACAKLLAATFADDPDAYVFHDLRIPGSAANIDHAVVRGLNVLLLDAKWWRPGVLVTIPRLGTLRGLSRFTAADSATMAMAHRKIGELLAASRRRHKLLGHVNLQEATVIFPSGAGRMSTALYRPAGGGTSHVAADTAATAVWLRKQTATSTPAPYGPLLRLLHELVIDQQVSRAHPQTPHPAAAATAAAHAAASADPGAAAAAAAAAQGWGV